MEFFDQFNSMLINITNNEDNSWSSARRRIYTWFQDYIRKQDDTKIERILKFITGTTRTPLITKINVCIVYDFYSNFIINI